MVIVGVLAASARGFSQQSDLQRLQANRDLVLLALRSSQHLALAKASAGREIQFVSTGRAIDVRDGNASVSLGSMSYPMSLPPGLELTAAIIRFDKLGRAAAQTMALELGSHSATITVASTGIAY